MCPGLMHKCILSPACAPQSGRGQHPVPESCSAKSVFYVMSLLTWTAKWPQVHPAKWQLIRHAKWRLVCLAKWRLVCSVDAGSGSLHKDPQRESSVPQGGSWSGRSMVRRVRVSKGARRVRTLLPPSHRPVS
jgi:hypothetical protein